MSRSSWRVSTWLSVVLLLSAGALSSCATGGSSSASSDTIKVGILHSLTGTMAISEVTVVNAEKMAIDEINAAGGVTVDGKKKKIEPIVEDGASDWDKFAEKATELLTKDKVPVVFGCWTSASRKAVLPVFEKRKGLLFYPVQYEGLESSPNIYYTGATTNQQIIPALDYLKSQGKKKIYLVASNYVFPQTANKEIKAYAKANGMTIVGEQYWELGNTDFAAIGGKLKAAKPDAVFNTLNGDSNVAFFKAIKSAGISAAQMPVMSVSIAEQEVKATGADYLAGELVAWNYYQTTAGAANAKFVADYKKKYGADSVTDDPMDAAYTGVHLWAQAVDKANSTDLDKVRKALAGMTYQAPEGLVTVDGENHHVYKTARIGQITADGQIKEVWNSGPTPIKPDPYLKTYSWWKS
jgi:urea transport system substrate-binding protein